MDQPTLERIFEPFFPTKPARKGTGLGLSVVYGICNQCNARIWVRSEPKHGTSFFIYFPVPARTLASLEISTASELLNGSETLLLVEDDDSVRNITRFILSSCGYDVLVAKEGAEALTMHATHPGKIALVISDLLMPRMTGDEMGKAFRSLFPEIKLLYITARADLSNLNSNLMNKNTVWGSSD